MIEPSHWWIATGILIAAELITGTFYLLMIALGTTAGAIAAHLGASPSTQLIVTAVVGGGSVALWHLYRKRQPVIASRQSFDIGETVEIVAWDPQGRSTTQYRGARWDVSLAPGIPARAGACRIVKISGSRLIVEPV